MARFRNTTSSPLGFFGLGFTAGPFAEFDYPGYDPEIHGAVPGCERIDDPADTKPGRKTIGAGSGTGDDTNPGGEPPDPAADAASEENPR